MVHTPAAVEELAHFDSSFGVSLPPCACRDVEDHSCQANRIIVAHRSLIAEAADPIDIDSSRQRPPAGLAFSGWLGKPCIEIGFERAIEKRRGVFG